MLVSCKPSLESVLAQQSMNKLNSEFEIVTASTPSNACFHTGYPNGARKGE